MIPFHLAIPMRDLEKCRRFYRYILGLKEGRSDLQWVDFNFFGHQLVLHQKPLNKITEQKSITNSVDGKSVPVPHVGVVLKWRQWQKFYEKLMNAKIHFVIEPYIRFKGEAGEQATMFFFAPEGNALEFKAFRDRS